MSMGKSTVDERIVEMRIDNEKFEAGAKKTIGILESLDRSLKGLGQDNANGFDNIEKSLDKVTDRFSAFGIVGDQIMRNLTNKAMEMVGQFKNMATMLTTQQIDAGWNKYADKTQAIQTIMAATSGKIDEGFFANQAEQMSWVNEQIEKLNKFTDETSYNFLDMVGNIGKFTAAGRELEESVTAMEGIANWAAISGGRPAEAGRAMYNLSQALGMGAVTTIDWKSIENANMATYEFKQQAIDAAVEMGTLKKVAEGVWETMEGGFEVTVENFRNSLSFGRGTDAIHWFNSDVLLSVLNRYGDFSDKLLDIVEDTDLTVTQYLKLLKAYKEGDAAFQEQIEDLSLTSDEVRSMLPDLERLSAAEYDLGFRAFQAAQEAKTFTEAIDATKDAVSTKWMTVFELLFGNYLEAKELWTNMAETFWDIFAKPVDHLIDIIKGSGGFLSEDGLFGGFMSGSKQAVGGTAVLEDRLQAVGKTMQDFHKALETAMGGEAFHRLIQDYHDVDNALLQGAISADTFKKALGALDDAYDSKTPVSLNRALNKAGKSMTDFEKAIEKVGDQAALDLIENFGGVEEALKRGGISAELFKKALESIGIDSENVSETIDQNVQASIGSLDELRQFALEVLRGDHGNGDERLAWYESMGLDSELMQAMAGNLKNYGEYISDEALMAAMESYYQYNNLAARLGYETFAGYLASVTSATEETIYDMNQMADEADDIYASLFGEGVLDKAGGYVSAGELFRTSLTNLLDALGKFGEAFDKAFMRVFGGGETYDDQVAKMSDGFFTLTAAFYSFSESVLRFSESDTFLNFATAMFSVLRMIGKAIGLVFKIGKTALSVIMKLLSPVLKLVSGLFEIITTGLDALSRSFESSGIMDYITVISDILLDKISKPIEKISYVIEKLISAFKSGFENNGGIVGGLRNMSETIDQLFENHPVFLTAVHAIGKALVFLKDAVEGLAMVLGGILGGAAVVAVVAFQKLGEWFAQIIEWARSSELMTEIWTSITNAIKKFAEVIKRVYGYAEEGFKEGGFMGAITAILASFERGVKRLVPGGEKLIEIFGSIKDTVGKLFQKKTVDENGIVKTVDDTEHALLKLEETADTFNMVFRDGALGNEEQQASFRENIKKLVANAWEGFLEGLRDIRIGDVINAMRLGVIANILLKVGHGLNIFNQLGENIKDIPETFSDMLEDLGRTFRSLSFDIKANAVLKFAVAAGIIAGAIFILAKIPEDKIEKASSVVIAILTVLALFTSALGKTSASILNSFQYLFGFGTALLGFAAIVSSIGTTALVLALVAKFVGVSQLREAAGTVIGILGVIATVFAGLIVLLGRSGFNEWQIKSIGTVIKSMGLGLMGIALAVQMLALPILLFCAVLKFARGKEGITKFAIAVGAVLATLAVVGLLMAGLIKSLKGFKKDKQIAQIGNFLMKAAASLIIVALALNMLVAPILLLAAAQKLLKLEINGVIGAMFVLGLIGAIIMLILAAFGGEMAKKHYKQIQAVGNTLLKMGVSMLIIALGVRLLMKPIIEIAKLSEAMESKHIIAAFMVLLGTIGILAGVLALLNKVVLKGKGGSNSLGLGKGLFRIAEGIFLLAAAALVLTPAIILMTAAVAGFAWILGKMNDNTWKTFENGLTRLATFSKTLAGFGAALLLVGLAATLTGAGVIAMAGGILILAVALSVLMIGLPKIVEAFEKLKDIDPKTLNYSLGKTLIIIGALIIMLVMFMAAINRIYSLLGGGVFRRIGENFVKTIEDIALGVRNGVSNGFTSVIQFLKNDENKRTILAILESLIMVGAAYVAGVLPTVAHVVIGGLVGLLNAIAAEVNAQAPEIVDAISNIVDAALTIAKGLIAKLFGEESWSEMSWWQKGIADLGGGLLIVNKIAGLFSFGKAEESAGKLSDKIFNLADSVSNMKNGFRVTKAAVELLVESVGGLSVVLPVALALAAAVAYANHELNAQQDILRENAGNPKSLEEYAASIEKVEIRIAELTEQEKNGLGTELSSQELQAQQLLLLSLQKEYEELQSTITDNPVEETRDYVAELQAMKTSVDAVNDSREKAAAMLSYKQALEDDAAAMGITVEELKALVEGYSLVETVASESAEEVETAQEQIETSTNGIKDLFDNSMITGMFGDFDVKTAFQNALGNQGIDINDLIKTDGSGLDTEKFKSLVNVEQLKTDLSGQLNDIGKFLPEGIADGIPGGEGYMTEALGGIKTTLVSTLLSSLGIASPSTVMANEVGQWIPAGIGMGIDQNYYQAVNPIYTMTDQMMLAFTNVREYFINAGTQIVAGLVEGIDRNMQFAYDAGQNLATSVQNGFVESLRIESPSRVFMNLARYIPMGISEGVRNGQSEAIDSIVVLSDALIDAIMQSMAMVSTVADSDFELTPRITPVVDMSNVDSAASSMNGMFGNEYNMSAQMSNAISRRMADVERLASNMAPSQTVNNGDNITFNIYGAEGQDPNEIADVVMLRMQNRAVRRGAAFG